MALTDHLTDEKAAIIALLEAEYTDLNLRDQLLDRLFLVRSLLGELAGSLTINGGIHGGDASADNQLLGNASLVSIDSNLAGINTKLPSSLGAKASTDSISQANAQAQTTLTQLTAAGSTAAVSMLGYTRAFITLLVASIDTNVVVRIEGTNDGTNWTNLSTANTDTTITANGTYSFVFVGCPASIRVTFVSESGGTAATIDTTVRVSA